MEFAVNKTIKPSHVTKSHMDNWLTSSTEAV
jgi:hypothetical protein